MRSTIPREHVEPGGGSLKAGPLLVQDDWLPDEDSKGWIARYATAIVKWRIWVLSVTLVMSLAAGLGLQFLTFNPDSRVFLGSESPQRLALERIENMYTAANSVEFIVAPKDGTIFNRRVLEVLDTLTDASWGIPHAYLVSSLSNRQKTLVDGDDIEVQPLYGDPSELTDEQLNALRQDVLSDRELINRRISADGSVAAVTVLVRTPEQSASEAITDIATHARDLKKWIEAEYPEVELRLTGGVIGDITFAEAAYWDSLTLIPLMMLVIAVSLTIGLNTVFGMLATLAVVGLSALIAMGIGGYLGFIVNGATSGAPVIIMTLAIADSVHVLTTVSHRHNQGLATDRAVVGALRINFVPIAITSITTAIGFLALNFSESPPLRELGTLVAIGALAAYVLSITFLPALLSLLPSAGSPPLGYGKETMRRLADFAIRWRHWLFGLFMLIVPVTASGIVLIEVNDNYVKYFGEKFDFRKDTDFMEDRLAGFHVLQFSLPSGESQGVTQPDFLETVDSFSEWLGQQEHVTSVYAVSQSIKDVNRTLNGGDPQFERLPETRALAAQFLIFLELSMPAWFDLGTVIDVDRSETLVSARLAKASSSDIRDLAASSEAWLADNAPEFATQAAGVSVAYSYITERNIRAMLRGIFFCLVLLSLILVLYLRSLRVGIISLIPNLVPAFMAFGLWGYMHGNVNLAISVVGAMTLGIVVDDTVHFLSKYVRARRDLGLSPEEAIRRTYVLVGPALIMTSVTLFLGFAVLSASGFAVSSQAGLMSAITIAIALIADVLFLPALLLRFGEAKK